MTEFADEWVVEKQLGGYHLVISLALAATCGAIALLYGLAGGPLVVVVVNVLAALVNLRIWAADGRPRP